MCETATDYKPGLYASWEKRIEHLEKTRYLLLGAQIAVMTFALNTVFLTEAEKLDPLGVQILHLASAVFALMIARLIENVSRGANTAATELMLLEYQMGVVDQGLGYYAKRAGRRRRGFRLLPIAGDLLSVLFIAASALHQVVAKQSESPVLFLFLILFLFSLRFSVTNHHRAEAMFAHKDSLDLWCQRNSQLLAQGQAGAALAERKQVA